MQIVAKQFPNDYFTVNIKIKVFKNNINVKIQKVFRKCLS